MISFKNTYTHLPDRFYQQLEPVPVKAPKLVFFNDALAADLGLKVIPEKETLAEIFSGNRLLPGSKPIAQAYAGHQYGHFVPQLGDGRAILLGEVIDVSGKRRDIQLKGSGQTRFSRRGDGRAALGPALREYILSEAMNALGIPTTRSLAVVKTGETVFREQELPGAVLTRVAASHIRVGTFEYFAARDDKEALQILTHYVIERHYPEIKDAPNPFLALLEAVRDSQASLVARWMNAGFIHGVMNTDNTALSGETIDYGPCAFLDNYDPEKTFSSIDHHGRYAYGNQGNIAQWNLKCLAECLLSFLDENQTRAVGLAQEIIDSFQPVFVNRWLDGARAKIGMEKKQEEDFSLVQDFLILMRDHEADYALTFRYLCDAVEEKAEAAHLKTTFSNSQELEEWLSRWRKRLEAEQKPAHEIKKKMCLANPIFIARNHRVEQALEAAVTRDDFSKTERLISVLSKPFDEQPENAEYQIPPKPEERVRQTFCGT